MDAGRTLVLASVAPHAPVPGFDRDVPVSDASPGTVAVAARVAAFRPAAPLGKQTMNCLVQKNKFGDVHFIEKKTTKI